MRSVVIGCCLILAGCATVAEPDSFLRADASNFTCRSEGLSRFVGQSATASLAAEMRQASGARTVRWTGPGMAVTMDYREDRLNIELDSTMKRVVRASCG
jgi:hypothetical protein